MTTPVDDLALTEPAAPEPMVLRQMQPGVMTPQQARVDAVAALTASALARAGTLQLTQEESERLTAEFADVDFLPGASGKENLIYIQHAALRGRLNSVLGLGQWALVVRESWNENFMTKGNPSKGQPPQEGVRVYVRAMMLVRGCYVGESVGDMDYYPGNAAQNYGDAFEGGKTAAFRRCAKEFGVGVQAWDKHWCDDWWARKRNGARPVAPAAQTQREPAPAPSSEYIKVATPRAMTPEERRDTLFAKLKGFEPEATTIFRELGLIIETELFTDLSAFAVERMSPDNMLALIKQVKMRKAESDQVPDAEVPDESQEPQGIVGTVEEVNAKDGKTKAGKPWVKYGIKLDGVWHNTFSDTLYKAAQSLKGQQARYTATQTQFGWDLNTLEAAGEVTP